MNLEDVISNFPVLTVDPVAIEYQRSPGHQPELVWLNDAFCKMFLTDQIELIGGSSLSLYHQDYVADFAQTVEETNQASKKSFSTDTLCVRSNGSSFWASVSYFAVPDDEGPGQHAVIGFRDIDLLKNREQSAELALIENGFLLSQVEAAQTRLISAINTIPDPFAIFDSNDRLAIWNPAFSESLSSNVTELKRRMKSAEILRFGADAGLFPEAVGREEAWLKEQAQLWQEDPKAEHHMTIRDREYRVIRSLAPNGDRVAIHVDISDLQSQKRELERYAERLEEANSDISHQAQHDELTGVGNRRFLSSKLDELIAARDQFGGELAALHIDLDRFKQVNDTIGHAAGDYVLETVADVLKGEIRENDLVARTGGDEFVVVLPCKATGDEPEALAERLIEKLSVPVLFEGRECKFGGSIGIARTPLVNAEDLLTSSDIALYKAKTAGRSRYAVFDHNDLQNLHEGKQLTDDIMRGLEKNEFIPFFQPQIDPFNDRVVSFEVVPRWQHPGRGLMHPSEFQNVAKEMQVEGQIENAILRRALNLCQRHYDDGRLAPELSFNVSLAQIMESDLMDELRRSDYPHSITLELAETTFLEGESDEFLARIDTLREMGIRFEVDDFGSGCASIIALQRIAPDGLKIDRRLVQPIVESEQAQKLVKSIVDIGQTLGIEISANGADTSQHVGALKALGCERLQGDHYSAPLSISDMMAFLSGDRGQEKAG